MIEEITHCPICNGTNFGEFLKCYDHSISNEWFHIQECKQCNLLLTSPRPTNAFLAKYYESEDYVSHSNTANSLINRLYLFARTFTLRWKYNIIDQYAADGKRILDYGCGTGDFLRTCKDHGWDICGMEPSPSALAKAKEKTGSDNLFSEINKTEGKFDIITLWHVLEHVPDLKQTIDSLKERLHENGTVFIAVPNPRSWDANQYSKYWAGYDVPRHLWHFSKENIKQLMENFGLRLTNVLPMKLDAFYVSLLSEKYMAQGKSSLSLMAKAFIRGLQSNIKAQKTREYSSLIYVIKK